MMLPAYLALICAVRVVIDGRDSNSEAPQAAAAARYTNFHRLLSQLPRSLESHLFKTSTTNITLSLSLFAMYYHNSVLIMKYRGRSIAVLQNECYRLEASHDATSNP
ncbi:hypothetical protein BGW80DRAFT_550131 [Lactifluus volemus]|nr:hypothetical protein BGW80DRAFT_550131 [Lactifluus volemus]